MMGVEQIDRMLGQSPCICGAVDMWHGSCYAGKTKEQVEVAYRRVYANIRTELKERRVQALASAIQKARRA